MTDTHLYPLCKLVQRFINEIREKRQLLENTFVTFLQVLFFKSLRQTLNEGVLLLDVKLFTNIHTLIDIVVYPPLKFVRQLVLFAELLESFDILAFLKILKPNVANQCSNPIDVVS